MLAFFLRVFENLTHISDLWGIVFHKSLMFCPFWPIWLLVFANLGPFWLTWVNIEEFGSSGLRRVKNEHAYGISGHSITLWLFFWGGLPCNHFWLQKMDIFGPFNVVLGHFELFLNPRDHFHSFCGSLLAWLKELMMDSMSMWQRTFWMGIASQCDSISPTSAKCAGKRKKKVGWKRLLTSWIPLPWPVDGVHYHYGAKKCHPLQHLHPLQYLHQLHTSIVLETSFMRTKKNGHDAICFHGVWWNLWKRAGIDQLTRILGLKTWFLFIIDNFLYGFFLQFRFFAI